MLKLKAIIKMVYVSVFILCDMFSLEVYMCTLRMQCLQRPADCLNPWSWSYDQLWPTLWLRQPNPAPMQQQQVLFTTEPSLWVPSQIFLLQKVKNKIPTNWTKYQAWKQTPWKTAGTMLDILSLDIGHKLWFLKFMGRHQ